MPYKMGVKEFAIPKGGIIVLLLAIAILLPSSAQAAEVGTQIYWAPEPGFGVLFMSVRVWPFEHFAVSGGMGETVIGNDTWPSLNAKALWRFMNIDTLSFQTAISLSTSYWLDDSLMPHFAREDFVLTMELEHQLTDRGALSLGVGLPVGWPYLALFLEAGFHVRY